MSGNGNSLAVGSISYHNEHDSVT